MDGKALSTEEQAALKRLSLRSDSKGLLQVAGHAAALIASGWLVWQARHGLWLAPALLLHGTLLVFLFCAEHEAVHRTAFRSRRLNDAVAWFCGLVILLPPTAFRAFHLLHHRHTQDPSRDPELARPKPSSLAGYLWLLSGLPFWFNQAAGLWRHARGRADEPYLTAQQSAAAVRDARAYLGIYLAAVAASLWWASPAVLLLWLLPVLLGQPLLRAYLLAEHFGCPQSGDMMRDSRTTETNWALRRLAWNMPFHGAHHAYPAVPFFALPAAQKVLATRPQTRCRGYLAFHLQVIRDLAAGG